MNSSETPDVFDVKKIRRLVQLMKDHELSEIDLEQGEQRIRLRRGGDGPVMVAQPVAAVPAPAAAAVPGASEAAPTTDANIGVIESPMVGTFYTASSPDLPDFVKVGDHVGPDSTVCIVEAMKVFNEIPAGISGKIVSVLVENGDPVEYGQTLYRVDTSA